MPPSTVTGVSPTRINLVQTAGDATSHNTDNDWTITGTRIQVIEDHNTPVYTVCFSLDNNRVALSRMIGSCGSGIWKPRERLHLLRVTKPGSDR